jgi:hypothetical protein
MPMIIFDLQCSGQGHVFEAWFGSSDDYAEQRKTGLIQCPLCGDPDVQRTVTAPRLNAKGNQQEAKVAAPVAGDLSAETKKLMKALAAAQKKLLAGSDYVGERFAEEARAIHLGELEPKPIHGVATKQEAASLIEEGIGITPLPFPIVEPGKAN